MPGRLSISLYDICSSDHLFWSCLICIFEGWEQNRNLAQGSQHSRMGYKSSREFKLIEISKGSDENDPTPFDEEVSVGRDNSAGNLELEDLYYEDDGNKINKPNGDTVELENDSHALEKSSVYFEDSKRFFKLIEVDDDDEEDTISIEESENDVNAGLSLDHATETVTYELVNIDDDEAKEHTLLRTEDVQEPEHQIKGGYSDHKKENSSVVKEKDISTETAPTNQITIDIEDVTELSQNTAASQESDIEKIDVEEATESESESKESQKDKNESSNETIIEDHEDEKIIEENAENNSVETEYSKEETEEAFETSTFEAELNAEDTGMY